MMICKEGRHCELCNEMCGSYQEVAPVVTAFKYEIGDKYYQCGACLAIFHAEDSNGAIINNYCPNCGATLR